MGKNAKLKEKQKWSHEMIHLENARKLRGIYFIDPEDKELKETIKNARKKLETSVAPAMPCKIMEKNCGSGGSNKIKTKLACILEADESTRLRMGNSVPNYHEDHTTGKGDNSLEHYNLAHKFIPMPQAMKIPAAKAAVDKACEKLEKISAWNLTIVRSKKEVIDEARTSGAKVHFASLMDICHLKNAELEAKHQKYKGRVGRVVLRGVFVKDDSGFYAVFTEQGSSESQMTAAKIMDITSRLPGCDGQATGAVSAFSQVKMEDARKLSKIPNRSVQTFGFAYHDTNGLNHGPVWKIQSFLLTGICTVILWQDYYGKSNLIQKIENHPQRHALQSDLQQHRQFNPFSKESRDVIKAAGNIELCELLDVEPKAQCKVCLSYWDVGIVYCTCGHFLGGDTKENNKYLKFTLDLFSIPNYYIKKGRPHGHRYGKKEGDHEYFIANQLKKKRKKRHFLGIHDRFIRDAWFRKTMIELGRTEEVIREMDKLANEDHTHHATEEELNVYRNNWWIRSNFVGSDTMPVRHEADFKEALSTLRRIKNEEDQAYSQNWWQSSSSSWWNWQDSWWHPSPATSPRRWTQH